MTEPISDDVLAELERAMALGGNDRLEALEEHGNALLATARRYAELLARIEGLAAGWKQRASHLQTWDTPECSTIATAMIGCSEELTRQLKEQTHG